MSPSRYRRERMVDHASRRQCGRNTHHFGKRLFLDNSLGLHVHPTAGGGSIGVTLDTYGHLFDGLDEAAADALDDVSAVRRTSSDRVRE